MAGSNELSYKLLDNEDQQEAQQPQEYAFDAPNATSAGMSTLTKKKILVALLAVLAVAAIVGAVAGTQAHSSSSSSSNSNSNAAGSSFEAAPSTFNVNVNGNTMTFRRRPNFSPLVGSLRTAPAPSVYHRGQYTSSARLHFRHTTVSATTGRVSHTHLLYDVEKNNLAHCASVHPEILGVSCNKPNSIGLYFANHTAAWTYAQQWGNGTVLFLRWEWGCGEHVRQFAAQPIVIGRVITVATFNTSIASAFHQANISFFTNHTEGGPDAYYTLPLMPPSANGGPAAAHHRRSVQPEDAAAPSRRRRGFWSDLGNLLGDVASNAGALVNAAVTGDLSEDIPYSSTFPLPSYSLPFQEGNNYVDVSGDTTFSGNYGFSTDVDLQIQSYSVSSFSASINADITATLASNLQVSGSYSNSDDSQLTQSTFASGVINVFDIPVPLNLILTVFGGYSVSMSGSASLSGSITAQGTAGVGIVYSGNDGQWTPWGSSSYTVTPNWNQPQFSAQASLQAYLSGELYLQTAYIGGPVGLVTVYGDLDGQLQNNDCITVDADVGAEVDAAAQISINIPGISSISESTPLATVWGPTDVWGPSQIFNYCLSTTAPPS